MAVASPAPTPPGAELITLRLSTISLSAFAWGRPGDRLAIVVHGYPDTAWTWRHLGPVLAAAGFRVVAPFTRGYAPSEIPLTAVHVGDLMRDVLDMHAALDGGDDAVLVGHDWGAITANGIAALDDQPFGAIVVMSVPPMPALLTPSGGLGSWSLRTLRQLGMSWYMAFNQIPGVSERSLDRLIPWLWRAWSPGYSATEDLAHVFDALPTHAHRRAALSYYRAAARPWTGSDENRSLTRASNRAPQTPILYLHGRDDGCLQSTYADAVDHLVADSEVEIVDGAGHFLQLEQPELVNARILEYLQR
ncbi:alpha/beta fold hydrolase [Williamsia sp. CHRR-6]|uniref:alpha/beta fold hydrolase n=1 Tax=Williamsia sp. CHRR-6 TaxID=2835871 RepID=UPI001BDAEEA9|nr:alpha/beta hydrolase [Williamsia sp. CHRR-6]MBT0568261.1 alpha/beta fold hydrolase [Williamsia sp. CHRR-6]